MNINKYMKKGRLEPGQTGGPQCLTVCDRDAFSVNEFCARFGIGRTLAYRLMREGTLRSVSVGGRRLIPATECVACLERLAAEAGGAK